MRRLTVRHVTRYHYDSEVTLHTHRMMLRPRDSHDLRLADAQLVLSPPASLTWIHDTFGNSIGIAEFSQPARELLIESRLLLERYSTDGVVPQLDTYASTYPFIYSPDEREDLGSLLVNHYPDPKGILLQWAQSFVATPPTPTLALLQDLNNGIRSTLTYNARFEEGTQTPLETLERKSGTCRDFALLMIEAARALGFAARFVSGYLYSNATDPTQNNGHTGAGSTHAWLEIFLPGAGWIEFDPTNSIIAGDDLIRVAVTRDPAQAIPISGSFSGGACLSMDVSVEVSPDWTEAGQTAAPLAEKERELPQTALR